MFHMCCTSCAAADDSLGSCVRSCSCLQALSWRPNTDELAAAAYLQCLDSFMHIDSVLGSSRSCPDDSPSQDPMEPSQCTQLDNKASRRPAYIPAASDSSTLTISPAASPLSRLKCIWRLLCCRNLEAA